MTRIIFPLLLLACDPSSTAALDEPAADPVLVEQALDAVRPGPLLALTERITTLGAADAAAETASCPRIDVIEIDEDGVPVRELWTGGCTSSDGMRLDGMVEIHTTDRGQWLAGSGLTVSRDGELELYFDGAIETIEQDELLLIEAAATWCSPEAPCSEESLTVDLTYSIYPAAGYPDAYDITVSGIATSASDAPITVDGSWSVNAEACTREPTNGAVALQRGERHDLGMDGALSCDGCAAWTVQGLDVPPYCGLDL